MRQIALLSEILHSEILTPCSLFITALCFIAGLPDYLWVDSLGFGSEMLSYQICTLYSDCAANDQQQTDNKYIDAQISCQSDGSRNKAQPNTDILHGSLSF